MKIKDSDIAVRSVAGYTKEGKPVIYIQSVGGLHALFKKTDNGGIEAVAAAPHIAIMKWMAEKKESGLKWEKDFNKSEDLAKSEGDMFQRMRNIMFAPQAELPNPEGLCMVYNYYAKTMQIMTKSEVASDKTVLDWHLVRDLSMKSVAKPKKDFMSEEE